MRLREDPAGVWSIEVYQQYVDRHLTKAQQSALSLATRERHPDYSKIVIAHSSMAEWMATSWIVSLNDHDFHQLEASYRREARQYIFDVRAWMVQFKQRKTGLALLAAVQSAKNRQVTISPYLLADPGAFSQAPVPEKTAKGRDGDTKLTVPCQLWPATVKVGTGTGADPVIRFTPDLCRRLRDNPGPDEVLFHEMVHASRAMKGVMDPTFVNHDYGNQEEYLAITLSNIYRSEKGQQVLRGTHKGAVPMTAETRDHFLDNSQGVNLPPMQLLDNFNQSQPEFYKAVADVPPDRAKFNPVRDHRERRNFQQFIRPRDRTGIF